MAMTQEQHNIMTADSEPQVDKQGNDVDAAI
jgi:hypothetical protein